MKKIYQIYELLKDIHFCVKSINAKFCSSNQNLSTDSSETKLATFLADSPTELQRLFKRVSEFPVPPIALGEIYVLKVYKKSNF